MKKIIVALLCGYTALCSAQIGGTKSAAEIALDRQSTFINAERERLLGNYDKALALYKQLNADADDVPMAYFSMARIYDMRNLPDSALLFVQQALRLEPQQEWYLLLQAKLQEQLAEFDKAAVTYQSLVKLSPNKEEYYYRLGDVFYRNFKKAEYISTLKQLEDIVGVTEKNSLKKIAFYHANYDSVQVTKEYQKLIERYPSRLDFRHKLAEHYLAHNDTTQANQVYQQILTLDACDAKASFYLASQSARKQSGSNNIAYLQTLLPTFSQRELAIDPKLGQLKPFINELNTNTDPAFVAALQSLAQALTTAHPTDPKSHAAAGDVSNFSNQLPQAIAHYQKAIALGTSNFSIWENLLYLYEAQKDYASLQKTAEDALDYFPNQPTLYYLLGVAYNQKGLYNDAANALKTAKLMLVRANPTLLLKVLYELGQSLIQQRNFADAKIVLEEALKNGGDKVAAIRNLYEQVKDK